jgi:hypothetical protein
MCIFTNTFPTELPITPPKPQNTTIKPPPGFPVAADNIESEGTTDKNNIKSHKRKDGSISLPDEGFHVIAVDPETGKGLKDWLTAKHYECGGRQAIECTSITFHDITPDSKTGQFNNVVLAHYESHPLVWGRPRYRVAQYEIDLQVSLHFEVQLSNFSQAS